MLTTTRSFFNTRLGKYQIKIEAPAKPGTHRIMARHEDSSNSMDWRAVGKWREFRPGMYYGGVDCERFLERCSQLLFEDRWSPAPGMFPSTYGVADCLEQILEHGRPFIEDQKDSFILIVTPVVAKDQEAQDQAWAWGDWGPYIGHRKPSFKYLGNQKEIERVYMFRFVPVVPDMSMEFEYGVA